MNKFITYINSVIFFNSRLVNSETLLFSLGKLIKFFIYFRSIIFIFLK